MRNRGRHLCIFRALLIGFRASHPVCSKIDSRPDFAHRSTKRLINMSKAPRQDRSDQSGAWCARIDIQFPLKICVIHAERPKRALRRVMCLFGIASSTTCMRSNPTASLAQVHMRRSSTSSKVWIAQWPVADTIEAGVFLAQAARRSRRWRATPCASDRRLSHVIRSGSAVLRYLAVAPSRQLGAHVRRRSYLARFIAQA